MTGESGARAAIFFDKDGTLLVDVPYNVEPARMHLAPGAGEAVAQLAEAGFAIIVVSNQSGVARGLFPKSALAAVSDRLATLFDGAIEAIYYCPHHPDAAPCSCRKPAPGMLRRAAAEHGIDLARSWMVGDILDDVEAGRRAGCRTILLDNGNETEWLPGEHRDPHFRTADFAVVARTILEASR